MTTETPAEMVDRVVRECGGDRDAALLLLAGLLTVARHGVSAGLLRLGPPEGAAYRRG